MDSDVGTVLPGLRDHHVHLGLVDLDALGHSVLSAVDDLGWVPQQAMAWRQSVPGGLRVRVAGPFLTASGGYPCGRSWAPAGSVEEVDSAECAGRVAQRLVGLGVDMIKVVLHTGMPLLGDDELDAVVRTAHRLGRPVVAHVEGPGQTARALAAGVDVLAHTPWTEQLPEDLVDRLARRMIMISALAIHREDEESYAVAVDNLSRFVRAGGQVRYGTDLGNGDRPAGLDLVELAGLVDAGLDASMIIAAMATDALASGWATWSPVEQPTSPDELVSWFATVRRNPVRELP